MKAPKFISLKKLLITGIIIVLGISILVLGNWIITQKEIAKKISTQLYTHPDTAQIDLDFLTIDTLTSPLIELWQLDMAPSKGAVLFFANFNQQKSALWPEAMQLYRMGYSVILVDQPNALAQNSSQTFGFKEAQSVRSSFNYVKSNHPNLPIYLYGFSTGANAIIYGLFSSDITPTGVILQSPLSSLEKCMSVVMQKPASYSTQLVTYFFSKMNHLNSTTLSFKDMSASIHCPVLFIHGMQDTLISWNENQEFYESFAGIKEMGVFERSGHESILKNDRENWIYLVTNFLELAKNH